MFTSLSPVDFLLPGSSEATAVSRIDCRVKAAAEFLASATITT